ncbi:MAG: AbrB/MazE/SpoVT family DNA-binding domain-containing protein [Spirochaetia bacterium]|nr:AbrB/MazE/SpoVT family DNA-binding domain-containing protein [Spirochaetia bacterium]
MKITIDNAGRVVIPKHIRERHHMRPGTELEIENEADGISLKVSGKKPSLIEKRGILVHHGGDTVTLDISDFINRAREQRTSEIAKGDVAKNSEAEYLDK